MNIQQIMKQAQQMQKQLEGEQNILKQKDFTGTSGNGAVVLVMTGDYTAKSITIDKNVVDPEDKGLLEDLIVVAINNCKEIIDKETNDKMGSLTNGMKLF